MSRKGAQAPKPSAPEPRNPWFRALAIGAVCAALLSLLYYWNHRRTGKKPRTIDRIEDNSGQRNRGARSPDADPGKDGQRAGRKLSKIEIQRNRIRMAALRELLRQRGKPLPQDPNAPDGGASIDPKLRARFELAIARDKLRYNADEMKKIDSLYGEVIDGRDSPAATAAVQELMDSFPGSNRTDCAAMNLAASKLNDGKHVEAATYLEGLISSNSGAVFGNGERVLPKALFNYGLLQQDLGNPEKARAAWQRLASEFPKEPDANGTPYGILAEQALKK